MVQRINGSVKTSKAAHVSTAIHDFCQVSPSTVQVVDDCPDSEEKWREAAARKNCAAHASNCSEPERLEYHCVINTFVNVTLEVCAYGKTIHLGYCTEYSLSGNIIQQSFRANCSQFTDNPCLNGYQSTDAYKYPECYGLTKKTTAQPAVTSTLSTTNVTHVNKEKQADGRTSKDLLLPVILVVVIGFIFAVIGMYLRFMRRRKKCSFFRKKDHEIIYEEELKSLRVTVDTKSEDINIAPSGQIIGNAIVSF